MGQTTSKLGSEHQAPQAPQAPQDCIFCNIVKDPTTHNTQVLYKDDQVVAFPDRSPAAARHLLVIPKQHVANVHTLSYEDIALVRHLLAVGNKLLQSELDAGLASSQAQPSSTAGQHAATSQRFKFGFHKPPFRSVDHLHLHCFLLPHKWYRECQYVSSINWITAHELLDKLNAMASSHHGSSKW
eukprot:jgi/Chrzof1/6507/Cz18g13250.t1